MEKKLINLHKVLELLKKQYQSDFFVIEKCINQGNSLKEKAFISIFNNIIAVTYDEEKKCYKISYNFNDSFWNEFVYENGQGVIFSPVFDKEDIIEINGENYIDEKIILNWGVFTLAELGGLN